jgi:hypothetical protein
LVSKFNMKNNNKGVLGVFRYKCARE